MSYEILCSKGTETDDDVRISEAEAPGLSDKTLLELRVLLEKKQVSGKSFISPDGGGHQYRFVMPDADKKTENYSDRVVGLSTEQFIPARQLFINAHNQIIITDTAKPRKPDLIGFETNYWMGGKLRVRCTLKNSDESAKEANKGKFEPIMLTNVVPTNEKIQLHYENVCICCEDSVVQFPFRCFGTVGFIYKTFLASGDVIKENAVHWAPYDKNLYGGASVTAWSAKDGAKNIVMKDISKVGEIDPSAKVHYQKITFTAWDVLEWKDLSTNTLYNINSTRPLLKNLNMLGLMSNNTLGAGSGDKQVTIGGGDIAPATPVKGDETVVHTGNWIVTKSKQTEEPQGTITVHFFVFKTLEKAKKYIDRYNILPPQEETKIWE